MVHPLLPRPSPSTFHTLRCYWSTARGNAGKVHFEISHSLTRRRLPDALGRELLVTHHPSPPLKLCIAIKWFFSLKGSKVAPGVEEGTPQTHQLKEAVLHQVWGVYADVIHHVDVLDGLVLSLDEGRAAGTRLNGTLFGGLWAGDGKTRKVTAKYRPTWP